MQLRTDPSQEMELSRGFLPLSSCKPSAERLTGTWSPRSALCHAAPRHAVWQSWWTFESWGGWSRGPLPCHWFLSTRQTAQLMFWLFIYIISSPTTTLQGASSHVDPWPQPAQAGWHKVRAPLPAPPPCLCLFLPVGLAEVWREGVPLFPPRPSATGTSQLSPSWTQPAAPAMDRWYLERLHGGLQRQTKYTEMPRGCMIGDPTPVWGRSFRSTASVPRERGREGKREGEKHQFVAASCTPPTGDLACNPGMCPDWESNWQPSDLQVAAPRGIWTHSTMTMRLSAMGA
ncbi:sodium/potassium-transporting ATPase subunit gamma isoform X2 [Artibeus jamaicensis]|uniref:sodium/potassium-transporting ATPase subunit gamma isoform X2 n=1 Tax=Artibeus jamaicensis TaxID=9417 RepID=UPI00235AC2A2|nr:sodium/potassium-transporting ATPase subunit gamma isoform X2 [Artibeus jamaicensis]